MSTLIIHGTEDPVISYQHALAFAQLEPAASLLTLPGVGHEMPRQEWTRIVAAILQHTKRAESPAVGS